MFTVGPTAEAAVKLIEKMGGEIVECCFAKLKQFRRVATRYDKLARNFLAGALIVATVVWWLN